MLGELRAVGLKALVGEDAAVHARMEGLHAAVEHLGEAGDVLDLGDGDAGLADGRGGRAGGDDLGAGLGEGGGEVDDARLVEDGEEGTADRAAIGGGHERAPVRGRVRPRSRAPRRSMLAVLTPRWSSHLRQSCGGESIGR